MEFLHLMLRKVVFSFKRTQSVIFIGTSKLIFSSNTKVGGYASKFLNDVEVIDQGTILVTDSSTNYDRRRFLHVLFEQAPVGRVIEIKISTGEARVILGGLHFANGIQMHPDKKSVIVSECSMSKILRLYISGPKEGEAEEFAVNLPGFPDNIRLSTQGTFYVGLGKCCFLTLNSLMFSQSSLSRKTILV
jgi:sugar lactone lactonase YvrE